MFLLIVYDVWLGYEFHRNLTGINDGSSMPKIIFYTFLFLLVGGLAVSFILLFKHWKKLRQWFKRSWENMKREREEDDSLWQ
jgi:hypothetical protein